LVDNRPAEQGPRGWTAFPDGDVFVSLADVFTAEWMPQVVVLLVGENLGQRRDFESP
jgi:hypothetical protein